MTPGEGRYYPHDFPAIVYWPGWIAYRTLQITWGVLILSVGIAASVGLFAAPVVVVWAILEHLDWI